ncbi:MAG: NFACT RNA binding domain-containing protein [Candidatus Micrarchaeia archaeon]|jgi:predicted ribosome quality control (RQC) complex YloA/Tae2 family protein
MKVELDSSLSVHQNAAKYYDASKEKKRKAESIRDAIADVEKRIASAKKKLLFEAAAREKAEAEGVGKKVVRVVDERKKEWFERFRWFRTSGGFLVVGGKDASQNEAVVAKYSQASDLFFHADIQGASVTILKTENHPGKVAAQDKLEAAQFAASNSSAWKRAFGSVDVYSVNVSQLSKKSQGEFVSKGSFVMKGQREWFRNTELGLRLGFNEGGVLVCVPAISPQKLSKEIVLKPGGVSQNAASKKLAAKFGLKDTGEILALLPGAVELS